MTLPNLYVSSRHSFYVINPMEAFFGVLSEQLTTQKKEGGDGDKTSNASAVSNRCVGKEGPGTAAEELPAMADRPFPIMAFIPSGTHLLKR